MAGQHTFIPYVRQGLANQIRVEDAPGMTSSLHDRATIDITLSLQSAGVNGAVTGTGVTQTVQIKGPGDIIGINNAEIIKTYPADWTTNFEPNLLPYIEFYDEDFPWRYTPAAARKDTSADNQYRLRPWLSLIVLTEEEFTVRDFNGILPSIMIAATPSATDTILPDPSQAWAWGHVQYNGSLGGANYDINTYEISPLSVSAGRTNLDNSLRQNPDRAASRLLSPRRLRPNTGYHAFLIPTFELGRAAGLGETALTSDPLAPAWTTGPGGINKAFPIYHQWFFKTGVAGDFESLVRMLSPKAVGDDAGKRPIDIQLPGIPALEMVSLKPTIGLGGVLKPVGQNPDTWPSNNPFVAILGNVLNSAAYLQGSSPDPIVAPPMYGKWHAERNMLTGTVTNGNWFENANLDPRFRIFAGAGAEVVRRKQDQFMAKAWAQLGEVLEANRALRQMQLAMEASSNLYKKHYLAVGGEEQLTLAGPLHTKLLVASGKTLFKSVSDSRIPNAFFTGGFRRMVRQGNSLTKSMRRAGLPVSMTSLITSINNNTASVAAALTAPSGMIAATTYLTVSGLGGIPSSTFTLKAIGAPLSFSPGGPSGTAVTFAAAGAGVTTITSTAPSSPPPSKPPLNTANNTGPINNTLNPSNSILDLAQRQIKYLDAGTSVPVGQVSSLNFIMAAPKLSDPMYKELLELGADWMMPGLNTLPNNSVSLLEMDQANIEAFMLGANYEMGRELLWRGYPTDQRGTYFSYFWDSSESFGQVPTAESSVLPFRDIYPIHLWRTGRTIYGGLTRLGRNSPRIDNQITSTGLLVLSIRGELFRRYPGAKVKLAEAQWSFDTNNVIDYNLPRKLKPLGKVYRPVFSARAEPDIYFLAFAADPEELKGVMNDQNKPGYFFVFEEQVTEMKFGADELAFGKTVADYGQIISNEASWDNLNWGNIQRDYDYSGFVSADMANEIVLANQLLNPAGVLWGRNSASMAFILAQRPVLLNLHAKELLM